MQIDLTKPTGGRMIDYWLGGTHNFEVDRQVAEQARKLLPITPLLAQAGREMVGICTRYMLQQGLTTLIDFGSALPTCENTHIVAHRLNPEVKVVYSDIDPVAVAYGQDLIRDVPNVLYKQCDAIHPETLLHDPEVLALIGDTRRVGFIFMALAHTLPDEAVSGSWRTLYDWAEAGSWIAMSTSNENWEKYPDLQVTVESYKRAGIVPYFRTQEKTTELLQPWRVQTDQTRYLTDDGVATNPETSRTYAFMLLARK
jgi:hypothetical protein